MCTMSVIVITTRSTITVFPLYYFPSWLKGKFKLIKGGMIPNGHIVHVPVNEVCGF